MVMGWRRPPITFYMRTSISYDWNSTPRSMSDRTRPIGKVWKSVEMAVRDRTLAPRWPQVQSQIRNGNPELYWGAFLAKYLLR